MVGQRACRYDLRCPRRGSNRMPKDGRSRGKRTCRCGDCARRCAPDDSRHFYSSKVIDQALAIYAASASAAAMGRASEDDFHPFGFAGGRGFRSTLNCAVYDEPAFGSLDSLVNVLGERGILPSSHYVHDESGCARLSAFRRRSESNDPMGIEIVDRRQSQRVRRRAIASK